MRKLTLLPFLLFVVANAFAAGRELAPRPLLPHRDFTQNFSIAEADGRFLAVWDANGSAYGVLLDANGRRISPSVFLIAGDAFVDALQVVTTGDTFAVFWIDQHSRTHLTKVDRDGRILGTRPTEVPVGTRLSAAWNGEQFLVVIYGEPFRPNSSRAMLLDREGRIEHEIRLHAGVAIAHVAVTGDGFIAFTGTRNSFFAHPVTSDGDVSQVSAGDIPEAIASMRVDDETLLVVTATDDGTMRSMLWKNDTKLREQIIATQHLGGILPVHLARVDGRNLLLVLNTRTESFLTMHVGDDGSALSELTPGSETRCCPFPAGASNGDVLVALHKTADDDLVKATTFDGNGAAAPAEILSIRPVAQLHARVGAGGGSMLAAWNEVAGNPVGFRVRTAMIDRNFEPQNVRELAAEGALVTQNLPWNGTEYLIVYQKGEDLLGARVSFDGDPIGEPSLIAKVAPGVRAAVTWAGDRWAIAWSDSSTIGARYVTMWRGGSASPPRALPLTTNFISDLAIAFDGSRVHVAWVERPFSPVPEVPIGIDVFTTRLRRDGRIVDAAPLQIPVTLPNRVAIAASSQRVLVVVDEEERSSLHTIAAKSRQLLSSHTLIEGYTHSDVTWDGYEFFAASAERRTLFVWRLGRDGSTLDDVRGTETLERDDLAVSIAASPGYDAVVGLQETDAAFGARAVIYANRELFRVDP